jgi:hypothetical protein
VDIRKLQEIDPNIQVLPTPAFYLRDGNWMDKYISTDSQEDEYGNIEYDDESEEYLRDEKEAERERESVRVVIRSSTPSESNNNLLALCKLTHLRDQGICANFPELYFYFYCPGWQPRVVNSRDDDDKKINTRNKLFDNIVMERLDSTLLDIELDEKETEVFAFEYLYSIMAFWIYGHFTVGDTKYRNMGLKKRIFMASIPD